MDKDAVHITLALVIMSFVIAGLYSKIHPMVLSSIHYLSTFIVDSNNV